MARPGRSSHNGQERPWRLVTRRWGPIVTPGEAVCERRSIARRRAGGRGAPTFVCGKLSRRLSSGWLGSSAASPQRSMSRSSAASRQPPLHPPGRLAAHQTFFRHGGAGPPQGSPPDGTESGGEPSLPDGDDCRVPIRPPSRRIGRLERLHWGLRRPEWMAESRMHEKLRCGLQNRGSPSCHPGTGVFS